MCFLPPKESYTNNILNELDPERKLFDKVLHRDDYPEIVRKGKDLAIGHHDMQRAILFDDRRSNFAPQGYENGVHVVPFNADRVAECCSGSWSAYLKEVMEMTRCVRIAFWSSMHYSGDARNVVKSETKTQSTKSV